MLPEHLGFSQHRACGEPLGHPTRARVREPHVHRAGTPGRSPARPRACSEARRNRPPPLGARSRTASRPHVLGSPTGGACASPASTSRGDVGKRSTGTSLIVSTPPGRSTRNASAKNIGRDGKWNAASTLITPSNDSGANGIRLASPFTGRAPATARRSRPARSCDSVMFNAVRLRAEASLRRSRVLRGEAVADVQRRRRRGQVAGHPGHQPADSNGRSRDRSRRPPTGRG